MTALLLAFAGAATGVAQAGLLARAARAGKRHRYMLARLVLVGAMLFVAARSGHILFAAVAWLVALAASVTLLAMRLR